MLFGFIVSAQGGPDAFGYYWKDNRGGPPQATFNWINVGEPARGCYMQFYETTDPLQYWIERPLTADQMFPRSDESVAAVPIPFDMTFYGTTHPALDSLYVSSNVVASFDSLLGSNDSSNDTIPFAGLPNYTVIAPFWDDMKSTAYVWTVSDLSTFPGAWAGWEAHQALVIEWDSIAYWSNSSPASYGKIELIITDSIRNGNNVMVWVFYGDYQSTSSTSASMGTENEDGSEGCSYFGLINDGFGFTPNVTDYSPGAVLLHDTILGDTSVHFVLSGDDVYDTIPAPFKIRLYGVSLLPGYKIIVSSNGWASLGYYTNSYRNNTPIPDTTDPDHLMAVFWDDLVVLGSVKYKVVGTSPNRILVIEWDSVKTYGSSSGSANFQIQIKELPNLTDPTLQSEIYFLYKNTDFGSSTPSATIGIESIFGDTGLAYTGSAITGTSPNISAIDTNVVIMFYKDVATEVSERTRDNGETTGHATVYSSSGRIVGRVKVEDGAVDLSPLRLPSGVYFVRTGRKITKYVVR